jgi:hypothetical protein
MTPAREDRRGMPVDRYAAQPGTPALSGDDASK